MMLRCATFLLFFVMGVFLASASALAPFSTPHVSRCQNSSQQLLRHKIYSVRGGGRSLVVPNNNQQQRQQQRRSSTTTQTEQAATRSSSGAESQQEDSKNNDNDDDDDESIGQGQGGMNLALAVSYFTVMGAKCALPTVLPLLLDPTTGLDFSDHWTLTRQELMSRQLTLATLAVAVGKLLLGPVIDRFGGILSLQVALTALCLLLAGISLGRSFLLFAVSWIFVDFIFSSCWAACINAIHQSFPQRQWAARIGTLAAAARMGNAVAFASFAAVLQLSTGRMRQPWRPVFGISAVIQLVPVVLLRHYGSKIAQYRSVASDAAGDTIEIYKVERPSLRQSLQTLAQEATTPEFWLHLISRSVLMVFASFLLFVPTLMCQVHGSSASFGAQTGSIYALGCLLSVTVVSRLYSHLRYQGKVVMLMSLLGVATASSWAQLAHMRGTIQISAAGSAVLLFLWGFAFAVPFYIPPSLYALSRGGVKSSATIADVFDIGGFSLLAIFNGYVASISHTNPAAWIQTFGITTACAAIALVTVSSAVFLEGWREESKAQKTATRTEISS